jgi:acyl-CoA thioester hydrolase
MHEHGENVGLAGELTEIGHRLRQRVYYEDTDFTGVVYHARYLHFFERGRTDFLRVSGVSHTELEAGAHSGPQAEKLVWIIRRMEIDYKAPAKIDDILTIETRTLEISGARIVMGQEIFCEGKLLCTARVEAALVNGEGRPRRFPSNWLTAFQPR